MKGGIKLKSSNKVFLIALTVCIILGMTSVAFAAGLSDLNGHWAKNQIESWVNQGLAKGYPDATFKPDNSITRAEFITLVNRVVGSTQNGQVAFSDVTSSDWFYQEIAKTTGYINGYEDGTFRPYKQISRQEVAVIIGRLAKLYPSSNMDELNNFADAESIPEWSRGAINSVIAKGYMVGYPDQTFRPTQSITRAESIVVLNRIKEALTKTINYDKAGTYGAEKGIDTIEGNIIISAKDVTLQNTLIKGNLVLTEGLGDGNVYLKNVTVKGTTTVQGGGANSIKAEDSNFEGELTVSKKDGNVRLVFSGNTSANKVSIESGCILEEDSLTGKGFTDITVTKSLPANAIVELVGAFENVDVAASNIVVKLLSGTVVNLNTKGSATGVTVDVASSASVTTLDLDAKTKVTGQGKIGTVNRPSGGGGGGGGGGGPSNTASEINNHGHHIGDFTITTGGTFGPTSETSYIDGTLTIDPGPTGEVTLRNIEAQNIVVKSGAPNSIHLFNVKIIVKLTISAPGQQNPVRVKAGHNTIIAQTNVDSGASLESDGGLFGDIAVSSEVQDGQTVELKGDFGESTVSVAANVTISVASGGDGAPTTKVAKIKISAQVTVSAETGVVVNNLDVTSAAANKQVRLQGDLQNTSVSVAAYNATIYIATPTNGTTRVGTIEVSSQITVSAAVGVEVKKIDVTVAVANKQITLQGDLSGVAFTVEVSVDIVINDATLQSELLNRARGEAVAVLALLDPLQMNLSNISAWAENVNTARIKVNAFIAFGGDASDALISQWKLVEDRANILRQEAVYQDKEALQIGFASGDSDTGVTQNLTLPLTGTNGSVVSWLSSNMAVIIPNASTGLVRRTSDDVFVTLTAIIKNGSAMDTKDFVVKVLKDTSDALAVAADKNSLRIGYADGDSASGVTRNINLPVTSDNNATISWSSSNDSVISANGMVTRPSHDASDVTVTLTATITKGTASDTKSFTVKVIKISNTDNEAVMVAKEALSIMFAPGDSAENVTQNLTMSITGADGTTINWTSNSPEIITSTGSVNRPSANVGNKTVILTATITKGNASDSKIFIVTVKCQNAAPTVKNVAITGQAVVGKTLIGSYTYSDVDADIEGATTYKWYRGDAVNGTGKTEIATGRIYKLLEADLGKYIFFEVTPSAQTGVLTGTAVISSAVGPVQLTNMAPTVDSVVITGQSVVGQTLRGSYVFTDAENDLEGISVYKWHICAASDVTSVIKTVYGRSYTLMAADAGKYIFFEVTPVAVSGMSPGTAAISPAVGPITTPQTSNTAPVASNVIITGQTRVGQTLTGSYSYTDADNDLEGVSVCKWYRGDVLEGTDKVLISGATGKSYTLVAADVSKYIFFEVTPVAIAGVSTGTAVLSEGVGPVQGQTTVVAINSVTCNNGIVAISGTTSLSEVSIKVIGPSSTILYMEVVKASGGEFTNTFTMPASAELGTYTVVVGQGTDVANKTFIFNSVSCNVSYSAGTVTINGTTNLNEVSVKVVGPSSTIVYLEVVSANSGMFTNTFTMPAGAESGSYTVVVGQGTTVATGNFSVTN